MARFIVICDWTDQGIKNVTQTVDRVGAARQVFEKAGAKMTEFFWCLGGHDCVIIAEAPDAETITAVALSIGKLGNVRTKTLRAFNEAEMRQILKKV